MSRRSERRSRYEGRLNPNAAVFTPGETSSNNRQDNNVQTRDGNRNENRDSDNLKGKLSDQLWNETYECMICCDKIRRSQAVWSCCHCYCIFHLPCIKKWASSCSDAQNENRANASDADWRCPGCQTVNNGIPKEYRCFCGKSRNPSDHRSYHRQLVPHTCGDLCKKRKCNSNSAVGDCPHLCTDPCHPGPCDPCSFTRDKRCLCGKATRRVRCGSEDFQCGQVCNKQLNCAIHRCKRVCHSGDCGSCAETIAQECFCGRSQRRVLCGDVPPSGDDHYSCGHVCDQLQPCGIHRCTRPCHEGPCGTCLFDPAVAKTCCCGKKSIAELRITRNSCDEPVPVCGDVCGKQLPCGGDGDFHTCASLCHPGPCPVCPLFTMRRCRCGSTMKNIPCAETAQYDTDQPLLCGRRCPKKRSCKQHKCGEICCIDTDHLCTLICGRKLSCGIHTCDALCHNGKCRRCLESSFQELTCMCGANVIYPPVPCGTKPPACDQLCTRQHQCQHPVKHTCHSEPQCPPCTFLTEKFCYGKHELRKNIPCYLTDVSCGRPCGVPLACGQHDCTRTCHSGACVVDGDSCKQPCMRPRMYCGHPCGNKCHGDADCPQDAICKFMVTVSCKCGHNVNTMQCFDIDRRAARQSPAKVEKRDSPDDGARNSLQRQNSVDRYKFLPCTDECARVERNRRFAEALEIKTDDYVGDTCLPSYTEFLKEQFKQHPDLVLGIEKAFSDLVTSLEKSSQTSRNHVFSPMNRNHRRVIHEYASYWDVDTMAYDQEPKRNIVATANKGKSTIPTLLLSTAVQKENAKPASRIVAPKANQLKCTNSSMGNFEMLPLSAAVASHRSVDH